MINDINKDAQTRMQKSLDSLSAEFAKIRTGRAHPSLLEHIMVDYYGNPTPLSQVAAINIADSRMLTVSPWEKNLVGAIEKAIMNSGLGLNPATSGTLIRVPMPPLSEERRREMVKLIKNEVENTRVAIRNIRRDAINAYKELLKSKDITEDDERRAQDEIQKITDKFIAEADKIMAAKEVDLMAI